MLNSFLENIACIADKNYQEKVWVRGEGLECDDIDDTICDFFDESYILEKYGEFGISKNQNQLIEILNDKLRKFTDEFEIYAPDKSTAHLIKLPEWQEIIEAAKNVIQSFESR